MPRVPTGTITYWNGLQFDGTNQYAQYNAGLSSSPVDNLTVAIWVKVLAYGGGDTTLFCIGKTDSNGYRLQITNAGLLQCRFSTLGAMSSGQTLAVGTWYHVALTRSGGTWQFYLDGAAVGATAATVPFAPNGWALLGAGKNSFTTVIEYFNGVLYDARFYNKVLTVGQILELYNASGDLSVVTDTSTMIGWWKCREETGVNLTDFSGNAQTMTVVGPPTSVISNAYKTYTLSRTTAGSRTSAGTRTVATI